jgi:hypothetical protein
MLGGASALSTIRRYKGVLFPTPLIFSEAHDSWNVIPLGSSVDRFTISSIQKAQKDFLIFEITWNKLDKIRL